MVGEGRKVRGASIVEGKNVRSVLLLGDRLLRQIR